MLGFLTFIPNLISGLFTTINTVSNNLSNERINLQNATTDREKAAIQERISALQATRDVLIADAAKSKVDMWIRVCFAVGPLVYIDKIFLYDKVLGYGSTDPLDAHLWYVVMVIIGFYFVHAIVGMFK